MITTKKVRIIRQLLYRLIDVSGAWQRYVRKPCGEINNTVAEMLGQEDESGDQKDYFIFLGFMPAAFPQATATNFTDNTLLIKTWSLILKLHAIQSLQKNST